MKIQIIKYHEAHIKCTWILLWNFAFFICWILNFQKRYVNYHVNYYFNCTLYWHTRMIECTKKINGFHQFKFWLFSILFSYILTMFSWSIPTLIMSSNLAIDFWRIEIWIKIWTSQSPALNDDISQTSRPRIMILQWYKLQIIFY